VPTSSIKNVVLIRLPSVTHTYDQDQRRVDLGPPVTTDPRYVRMQAPANGNACPPGPYMMFMISNNGRGTPSVAKIVRVGDLAINRQWPNNGSSQSFQSANPTGSPTQTGSITVNAAPGVSWTATSTTPSWLTINMGSSSGTGNGTINFTVANNTGTTARLGAISVKVPGREATPFQFIVYQAINFTDVQLNNPFNRFVSAFQARGLTAGCGANVYCPNSPIVRGGAAVFLSLILTPPTVLIPDVPPGTEGYSDLAASPYRKFVANIKRRGIPDGCGGTNYCPDADMTRKDVVVWIMRSLGITNPPPPTTQQFIDVPLSDPAAPFIAEAVRRGLTAGCGGGYFCPTQSVNRGEIAVFLTQAFGL